MKTVWATVQSWMMPPEPAPKKVRPQHMRGPRGPMKSHAEYTMQQAMLDIDSGKARKKKREKN
jgi:hypothetical protein